MLGNFELLEEIGRGGMGVVYRARQVSLNRIVALKVLTRTPAIDQSAAERFQREALAMAQLQHPGIVDVIEVGSEGELHYFAMRFVEGESLEAIINRDGPLTPERAAEIAAQVADALQHAHERGLVHRDIKPGNILIGHDGSAVVTDFGIAKAMEGMALASGQSLTQGVIGTPEYMSPEVIRGNPVDGRTDIYSLAIVIYQMLTARVPFTATSPFRIADLHLRAQPTPPTAQRSDCPGWLESIALRGMLKEPSQRFGTADEMARALRDHITVDLPHDTFQSAAVPHPTVQTPVPAARISAQGNGDVSPNPQAVPRWIWGIAGAGVLMLIVAVAVWIASGRGGTRPPPPPPVQMATVPALEGLDFDYACGELSRLKLRGARADNQYHDRLDADCVISQSPAAGTRVEEGTEVDLVVSLGAVSSTVPNVTGLSAGHAEDELRSAGFAVEFRGSEFNDSYAADTVAFQSPPGGGEAEPGSTVYLTISKGIEPRPTEEQLIVGTWQRTQLNGKPTSTGQFAFHSDGTATYTEAGRKNESHGWRIDYVDGLPVLVFTSSGNSYWIDSINDSTMTWRPRATDQKVVTTSFRRR